MKNTWMILLVALFLTTTGCDESEEPGATEPAPEPTASAEAPAPEELAADDDPHRGHDHDHDHDHGHAVDLDFEYPGVELSALSEAQRSALVGMAISELCPCPDAVVSLHECMQEAEQCEEANTAAARMIELVSAGTDQQAAQDALARERATTGRVHTFSFDGVPHAGNPDADVVIVEFADFQCPHCRTAAQVMEGVKEQFGDQIVVYFKNFPLGHPTSDEAARASMAAHEQGRFWQMHRLLFEHQSQLDSRRIQTFAHQLGINYERFQEDLSSSTIRARVLRDREEAIAAGVTGTPALFINGRRYTGALSAPAISAHIRAELDEI